MNSGQITAKHKDPYSLQGSSVKKKRREKSVRDSRSMRDNSKKVDEKGIDIHLNFHLNPSLKSSKTIENLNLISGK